MASMKRKYEPRTVPEEKVATTAMIASLAAEGYDTVSAPFGHALVEAAKKDDKIVAITAAMPGGTGLDVFEKAHPTKMFDVGIAEQHAVTFAAGLAATVDWYRENEAWWRPLKAEVEAKYAAQGQ